MYQPRELDDFEIVQDPRKPADTTSTFVMATRFAEGSDGSARGGSGGSFGALQHYDNFYRHDFFISEDYFQREWQGRQVRLLTPGERGGYAAFDELNKSILKEQEENRKARVNSVESNDLLEAISFVRVKGDVRGFTRSHC